ncbi:hypothetical protein T11_12160 [Trichinella zimbabwensis]|uniref:Uncharacterized protein n=1 Tax=Trichinella zimbabwensis TaxID=268475 RepID=A0A0V1HEH3_9BILA|nr:hypothetical protein T11_12160 [Trichinella zimbabwensis]
MQSALNIHGMCVPAEPRMSNTFPRILAAFIPTDSPMPYNPTQLSESCQGFHGPSIDFHYIYFMHYVFTQILRYSHAVLDCVSMKAEVWTCPDMSGLVSKRLDLRDRCCLWLSRYHYCYDVEPHKRKQPCTEPADPQSTHTLGSKNRIYLFGGFKIREC